MSNVHLLVLVHGMWGNPKDLAELARVARETYPEPNADGTTLHILMAETVREDSTYDGVDWGGEKVATEVLETVRDLEADEKKVVRFSITGYSLGGLISRYCVGVLDQQGFFKNVEPVNFNTIATPHCGLPQYPSFLSKIASKLGPKLLSRTGEQFYCVDKWTSTGRPLLVVMADPNQVFYRALQKFEHIRIYANVINDITVPYVTAAIETQDPFINSSETGIEIGFLEDYPCLIKKYSVPDVPPPPPAKPRVLTADWFRSFKPRPFLPPFLRLKFPFNLIVYALLPVLIPAIVALLISRFALASRSSRSRIKLFEKESKSDGKKRLIHILTEIEHEMEEAVLDLMEDPDPAPGYQLELSRKQPIVITQEHKRIAAWLNTLPIKKELAYFENVVNSHAMIVCRDPKRFEFHRTAEPVVRHWANYLIV